MLLGSATPSSRPRSSTHQETGRPGISDGPLVSLLSRQPVRRTEGNLGITKVISLYMIGSLVCQPMFLELNYPTERTACTA